MKKRIFDPEKMLKKANRKSKPKDKIQKTKRVNFSWLNNKSACRAKAYMAYIGDRKKKRFLKIGQKRAYFMEVVLPPILSKFPKLYKEIRSHYHEKGRKLNREEYIELLYARFVNMYTTSMEPADEHPKYSPCKALKKYYRKYLIKR